MQRVEGVHPWSLSLIASQQTMLCEVTRRTTDGIHILCYERNLKDYSGFQRLQKVWVSTLF